MKARCRLRRWVAPAVGALVSAAVSVQAEPVAYWRFEEGPAGANVPHAGAAGAFDGSTPDVSGNGNSLSVWSQGGASGFAYRSDVPDETIAATGAANRFSIKNTGSYPAAFTSAAGSQPTGINADTMTPAAFTVEASYRPEASGGYRTVVGRDARNVATTNGDLAALYLQVRPDDSVGIQFTDLDGFTHQAYSYPGLVYGFDFAANPEGAGAEWYHLVGVSDGSTLRMYVNNVLVASTDMTGSGGARRSLARGTTNGADWQAGAWSVGRGLYAGGHTDRAFGFIDEVRISNHALAPREFLFANRAHFGDIVLAPRSFSLAGTRGQPGAPYTLYYASDAGLPLAAWTQLASGSFDADGQFSFAGGLPNGGRGGFFHLQAQITPPPQGPLTYELAGGSAGWPADIRERIVYAMEGAVALYNKFGGMPKHLYANYNPGVPTAQASYSGWIDFGGQIGYRTALHEISHTLGVGTHGNWWGLINNGVWTGIHANRQIREFDGPNATVHSDGTHFWPYGLNYDNESNTEANRRHVLMVAAFRRDLGLD